MELIELIEKIQQANAAYAAGIPFLTDTEYDVLWQELFSIDPTNSLLFHTANNQHDIGTIPHKYPVFGTNKAFNMLDLMPFLTRFGSQEIVIEPKYDGCAAVITMTSSGWQITLEGNGISGTPINHLKPYIQVPFHLRHFQTVELLIPWSDWNPEFGKNPRNVVAGWLARKHTKPTIPMTAVSHNAGNLSHTYNYDGDTDSLNELLLRLHTEWSAIFPIDGLMLKVKDEKSRLIAGNNGTTSAWSIAWKPPIQTKTTIVTSIEWNVSRLGRVIPTVIYEPIELCGTTNKRVTANNAQWILDREIMVGSKLIVGKAGEIIPKIVKVENFDQKDVGLDEKTGVKGSRASFPGGLSDTGTTIPTPTNRPKTTLFPLVPGQCPICASKLTWQGVHLVCESPQCIAKLTTSVAYFYSKSGIQIEGIAVKTIEKLLYVPECYNILKDKPWALLDPVSYEIYPQIAQTLGQKTVANIMASVNAVNHKKTMAHFISGLGMPGLAYKSTLRLCQYLKTGKLNIHVSANAQKSFIESVPKYNDAANEMKIFNFAPLPNPAKAIYCITGTLSTSREVMIETLSQAGYEFSSSVTREVNYLIVGDEPGKVKREKAEHYNIPQVTEDQLFKLINGG